ncbi:hypothetical protein D9V29_14070 [Mycetocola manganoxydans]|uniref:Uncharacterized protein n=1 Tax=Mycetocola manganoxydans TaxID=699879 RepID=A0A3L6ZK99_9MICO|nr:hypothetical protein [Mycetocola manganoxydans]RLP68278.1 hypothetical protein D9V29_14070 [Mycetocola manganoxydans]
MSLQRPVTADHIMDTPRDGGESWQGPLGSGVVAGVEFTQDAVEPVGGARVRCSEVLTVELAAGPGVQHLQLGQAQATQLIGERLPPVPGRSAPCSTGQGVGLDRSDPR